MSRYIDWKDVVNRYADAAKSQGGSEEVKISFVNGAEDEIDAALAMKYTTPFSTVPGLVRDLCIDLSYYKMNIRVKEIKTLKDYIDQRIAGLQSGALTLTLSGTPLGQADRAWSTTQDFGSSFGVDRDENWHPDSNWQDDFKNRRC